MKLVIGMLLILCQTVLYGQGAVLDSGQSGAVLGYGLVNVKTAFGRKTQPVHSVFYGYSVKRRLDIQFNGGKVRDDNFFGTSLSFYSNAKGLINLRGSLFLTKIFNSSDFVKGVDCTFLFGRFTGNSRIIPRVGLTYSGEDSALLTYGADIRIGDEQVGLLLGIDYINPLQGNNSYFGFSLGVLFVDKVRDYKGESLLK